MAAKAIVAERQSIALGKVREHAAAVSRALGVDATALGEYVKGDAAYQEMVRTEQLADLLDAVRAKVAPQASERPEAQSPPESAPAPENATSVPHNEPDERGRAPKATKTGGRSHK